MAGNYIPYVRRDYLSISGGTLTGDTAVLAALTATTYYSGSTPLEQIIYDIAESTEDITRVQGGLNTYTGGTSNLPTVNVSGLSIDNIFVSGVSRFNSLSATSISANSISLEVLGSNPTYREGLVFYGPQGLSSYLDESGVTLNLGQEQYIKVYNGTGALIQNGKVVTIVGASGGFPSVSLAIASGGTNQLFQVDGVATHDIEDGSYGYITNFGFVRDIDLTSFQDGDVVYLSESVYGGLSSLSDLSVTARTCEVGHVIDNSSSGALQVNILNERNETINTIREFNILNANNTSSGVFYFEGITLSSSTSFNVGAIKGWVVDSTTSVVEPTITYVQFNGLSGETTPYLNTDTQTYILLTSSGTLSYQNSYPTPEQRRQNIYLGKLGHANKTSLINAFNEPDYSIAPLSQVRDFFTPIKFVNDGILPSSNGSNLSFNVSAGSLYGFGIGVKDNPLNPNSIDVSGSSPTTFQYRTQTGGTASSTTLIDPTKYDNGGVVTSVGGGSNSSTNQRIYLIQNGVIRVQYGQQVYSNIADAIAGVQSESFTTFSNFRDNAILIGILSVNKTCTDLSDTTKARFLPVSKFGETVGAAGGVSTTTLQQAYDNSTSPEIVTNSTLDGFQIRGGTGSDDAKNLIIENNLSVETAWIKASGQASFSGVSSPWFSGNTFYSAGTNLETIITNIASGLDTNDVTRVQGGLNTYTGGTGSLPTVNVSGLSIDNIFVSGNSRHNSLTGGTISGGTYYSGGTPLETIITSIASGLDTNDVTRVQGGLNTYTGGTSNLPTINVSGGSFDNIFVSGSSRYNSLTGGTISGGTYFSGSTPLESIIHNISASYSGVSGDHTRIQSGLNTYTGGTSSLPTVNVSGGSFDNIFVSGSSRFNSISGGTISGNTYYSGNTPLDAIIHSISASYSGASGDHTRIQGGLNTYTGGTSTLPTVNVSGGSFDNIFVSGSSRHNSLTGGTISGGTYYSGSTPLSVIINNIASQYSAVTHVQGGSNIITGGTEFVPIISVVSSPSFSSITFSGVAVGTSLSGTTDRLVEVNSGGTFSATRQIISAYITSGGTIANILENTSNWDINGVFVGTGITGTYMGQKHYNSNYFFEAVDDDFWIRLIRG